MRLLQFSVILATTFALSYCDEKLPDLPTDNYKWPTIGVSILVRNKAHSLPSVLTCLEHQDYPKDRIYVWFYVDKTSDTSLDIINTWTKKYKAKYNKIFVNTDNGAESPQPNTELDATEWTEDRLKHLIKLREKALAFARERWADYIFKGTSFSVTANMTFAMIGLPATFQRMSPIAGVKLTSDMVRHLLTMVFDRMMDADVFLTEPTVLKKLIGKKMPIVAPMLISDGLYSNFWAGMSDKYYYEKTDEYEQISNRDVKGCFEVPMVHSAVLVDLRTKKSDLLTYDPTKFKNYDGPVDDIIAFALSAKRNDIPMSVCNEIVYGFLPIPVDMTDKSISTTESEQLLNVKLEALAHGVSFPLDSDLARFVSDPPRDRLGVHQVYMINLERRSERRRLMELSFKELGVDYTLFKAFDGQRLDMRNLSQLSVTLMPKYEDPFHKRPMKAGEIGCFLSHYHIWKEIAKRHIGVTLVLEDDIHFTPFFRRRFEDLLNDLDKLDWELVYIGRKVLQDEHEELVTPRLSRPLYSYWTLGYLLSENGARKLLRAEPLAKMLPVDEFLPIMFDQHPNETWKSYFPRRDLKAFSASPLLVHPTHYTGQEGYISDTEDSRVLRQPSSASPPAADRADEPL